MLTTISPTRDYSNDYLKSKCAEIHYKTTNFSILCVLCGMTTLNYTRFVEHFQSHHFDDFTKTSMLTSSEPHITAVYTTKLDNNKKNSDPLEFGEDTIEETKLKTELQDEAAATESNSNPNILYANCDMEQSIDDQFNDSDDEYLICKIKVEQADILTIGDNTSQISHSKIKLELESVNNASQLNSPCPAKDKTNDKNLKYSEQIKCTNEKSGNSSDDNSLANDIDWGKSYEPNLLKNHDKRPYKPRNKPNTCSYCGRTFRRRYQLETHVNIHTGSKPHQCDVCGKLFRAITTLTRHLNTHESRRVYNCKYCDKEFTHRAAQLSHQLRHTQERNVPCGECGKLFYTLNQMDTHRRKVHKVNEEMSDLPYACELCPKRYRSASMLSTHKFKKHYKTAKHFCEQCGEKFIDEERLEKHKLIHVYRSTQSNE